MSSPYSWAVYRQVPFHKAIRLGRFQGKLAFKNSQKFNMSKVPKGYCFDYHTLGKHCTRTPRSYSIPPSHSGSTQTRLIPRLMLLKWHKFWYVITSHLSILVQYTDLPVVLAEVCVLHDLHHKKYGLQY